MEISRGCQSTGWCLCFQTSHTAQAAGLYEEEAQDDFFADTDFRCPAVAKTTIVATKVDGGWTMTGDAPYSSGSPYANWSMGQTLTPDGTWLLYAAPRDTWTRLDDWGDALGLKGSGSHTIRFENAFLPDRFVLENVTLLDIDVSRGTPGYRLHGNPFYAGRTNAYLAGSNVAVMVGGVKGAVDEFERLMQRSVQWPPLGPRAEDGDYQRWLGLAIGKVATAEAALLQSAEQWMELVREGAEGRAPFRREDDLRLNIIGREAMTLAWDAMQSIIFRTAGSGVARNGQLMERMFRDAAMGWGHFTTIMGDLAARELAKERLGIAGSGSPIDAHAKAGA
jgi:3-hydroxy-9,10-secoandrosta-1,3,5(10)-triene-9,17-dione monooxygenase